MGLAEIVLHSDRHLNVDKIRISTYKSNKILYRKYSYLYTEITALNV